ncbi:putative reverse transcriptase domain-containing protein [Tanacetum coccineum]
MKCAGLYIFSSKVERNSTLVVIESVFSAIGKTFYLGARGQSFHNLTPFILEERGPKRHFQQHLLSLWCNACGYNASAQNDNEVLEAESIVQAASTECVLFPGFVDVRRDVVITVLTSDTELRLRCNSLAISLTLCLVDALVGDALSRKKRVKSRRVCGMRLAAQGEASKQENDPQADGQSERMIQALEDIMRACVIEFGGSYHLSIWSAPFEALYGRKCRSPVLWAEIGESSLTGLELVQETTDKVVLVKEKPKAARDRQKGYVDCRRKPLEFKVEIGGLADANLHVLLDEIKVDKTLCFLEEPVEIMDREIKKLKRRKIALVKVRWNSKRGPEFTRENEDHMRIKYPQLFVDRVVEPAS